MNGSYVCEELSKSNNNQIIIINLRATETISALQSLKYLLLNPLQNNKKPNKKPKKVLPTLCLEWEVTFATLTKCVPSK